MSSEWNRRFWKVTSWEKRSDGYTVLLDGRTLKTPAKNDFLVPSVQIVKDVAAEWDAQGEKIDPNTLPVTRMCNVAIDKMDAASDAVVEDLVAYGDSDLLCYRAGSPEALVLRQAEAWDPVIEWITESSGEIPIVTTGIMPVPQSVELLVAFRTKLKTFDHFQIGAVHELITLSGSLMLGLAVADRFLEPKVAWKKSRVDEIWQAEQWGADEDATSLGLRKEQDFYSAARFLIALDV